MLSPLILPNIKYTSQQCQPKIFHLIQIVINNNFNIKKSEKESKKSQKKVKILKIQILTY